MSERFRRLPGPWLKWVVLGLAGILIAARFVALLEKSRGDFDLHYGLAERLVHGEFLYGPGFDRVYPPFWAFVHAPFTLFARNAVDLEHVHRAEILIFPFGVAGMVALVWVLKKLADRPWPVSSDLAFWSGAAAILLASPFLHRDLVELGVNTFLVLLTWVGVLLWTRGRSVWAGVPIGLAAAMKCTPVAFVFYFFWKREWKVAVSGLAATVFFTCLPATLMGIHEFAHTEAYWLREVWQGMSDPNPSRSVLGPDRVGNLSLRTALARYLIHLPYGDPGRPETPADSMVPDEPPEPLYFDVITLRPATAGKVVKLILLLIAVGTAWLFRHRAMDRHDPRVLWECAALSIAILLYSPLTWAQHCPGVLPALYFLFRVRFAGERLPRFVPTVVVGLFIVIVVLERGLIGLRMAGLLDAYHLRNFALLALFWATLRCRNIGNAGQPFQDIEGSAAQVRRLNGESLFRPA